jgi:uncharacterized lipoprotein YmbA
VTRSMLVLLVAGALAACGSSPAPRLYTLDSSAPGTAGGPRSPLAVYVGPVVVPEAVDRPQLVVRSAASEVTVLDGHRWAEPLKVAIGRVLAAKLSRELGTPNVGAYPGAAVAGADYRVQVEVQRFESAPGGAATIEAVWSVRRGAAGAPESGRTVVTEPVAGGYESIPLAHSRALAVLSRDIAAAIRGLEAASKPVTPPGGTAG